MRAVFQPTYWEVLEAHAAMRREQAFQAWRESRYTDQDARDRFLAYFCAANSARSIARTQLRQRL